MGGRGGGLSAKIIVTCPALCCAITSDNRFHTAQLYSQTPVEWAACVGCSIYWNQYILQILTCEM